MTAIPTLVPTNAKIPQILAHVTDCWPDDLPNITNICTARQYGDWKFAHQDVADTLTDYCRANNLGSAYPRLASADREGTAMTTTQTGIPIRDCNDAVTDHHHPQALHDLRPRNTVLPPGGTAMIPDQSPENSHHPRQQAHATTRHRAIENFIRSLATTRTMRINMEAAHPGAHHCRHLGRRREGRIHPRPTRHTPIRPRPRLHRNPQPLPKRARMSTRLKNIAPQDQQDLQGGEARQCAHPDHRHRDPPQHGVRLVAMEAEHRPLAARGDRARHVLGGEVVRREGADLHVGLPRRPRRDDPGRMGPAQRGRRRNLVQRTVVRHAPPEPGVRAPRPHAARRHTENIEPHSHRA